MDARPVAVPLGLPARASGAPARTPSSSSPSEEDEDEEDEEDEDEIGLCWPREISPADVHLVATGKEQAVFDAAETLTAELEAQGLTVLYDDRPKVSPGVKFKDAELIGVPTIVVIGKGLANGTIEIKDRRTGERREVPVAEAAREVLAEVRPGAPV